MKHCEWKTYCGWEKGDFVKEYYDTDCGHSHFFETGGVKYNEYKYCQYCGRKIKVVK
jgi:hypothetical protein